MMQEELPLPPQSITAFTRSNWQGAGVYAFAAGLLAFLSPVFAAIWMLMTLGCLLVPANGYNFNLRALAYRALIVFAIVVSVRSYHATLVGHPYHDLSYWMPKGTFLDSVVYSAYTGNGPLALALFVFLGYVCARHPGEVRSGIPILQRLVAFAMPIVIGLFWFGMSALR